MTDSSAPLKPGDTIVSLPGLSIRSGALSGLLTTGLVLGHVNSPWPQVIAGAMAGGVAGFVIGQFVARSLFPGHAGQATVIRVGKAALPSTFQASAIPTLLASFGLGAAAALAVGVPMWPVAPVAGALVATVVVLLFGVGSALKK